MPAHAQVPADISKAIADPARPDADKKADADRKPGEVLAFAGIKPGEKVADLIPGGGYFTRLFSKIVGPSGHVYAVVPAEMSKMSSKAMDSANAIAADPAFSNVSVVQQPLASFGAPEKLDVVWTSQNYHDLHNQMFGPADMKAFDKAVFDALKPGGEFIVLDHAAAAGSGTKDTSTLHRIDPAAVKAEVEAVGFKLESESKVLANPADDHTLKIFDPAIRGKTDKFLFKFRKPAH